MITIIIEIDRERKGSRKFEQQREKKLPPNWCYKPTSLPLFPSISISI